MTTIEILEWMIKEYEKRGGGYSQIEALKEAISALSKLSVVNAYDIEEIICPSKNIKCVSGEHKICIAKAQAIHNLITNRKEK